MAGVGLLKAKVGHARFWPKKNAFIYKVFYTKILIDQDMGYKKPKLLSFNKFNVFSIYDKDYGFRQKNRSLYEFIETEMEQAGVPLTDDYSVFLISHPRILGYAFNPISYWLILDKKDNLKAVLCEVHNTFGDTHNYFLSKSDNKPIEPLDTLTADKKLYVSPYNKVVGYYEFNFTYKDSNFKSVINYFDKDRKILNTYVGGEIVNLSSKNILHSLFMYPAMTMLVVLRIHWQALRLLLKRVKGTMKYKPKNYISNKTTRNK